MRVKWVACESKVGCLSFDRTQDKLRNAQMKFIEFEFDLCRIELDIFRSFVFFRGDNNFQPLALIIV